MGWLQIKPELNAIDKNLWLSNFCKVRDLYLIKVLIPFLPRGLLKNCPKQHWQML